MSQKSSPWCIWRPPVWRIIPSGRKTSWLWISLTNGKSSALVAYPIYQWLVFWCCHHSCYNQLRSWLILWEILIGRDTDTVGLEHQQITSMFFVFFQQTKSLHFPLISWWYSRDIPMIFPYLSRFRGVFFQLPRLMTLQGSVPEPSGSQIVQAADPSMSNFNLTSSRQVSRWLSQHGPRSSHLKLEKLWNHLKHWTSYGYIWVLQLSYPYTLHFLKPSEKTHKNPPYVWD